MMSWDDPVIVAQHLMRYPGVTPDRTDALADLAAILKDWGFLVEMMPFSDRPGAACDNLYAVRGDRGPLLCFAGHSDVVPVGDAAAWRHDPFGAVIADGILYGRGAVDMKGNIACFMAALARMAATGWPEQGRIAVLITGDEEGDATNGTVRVVETLRARGVAFDGCIVTEPTSVEKLGDTIKIGRRGSLSGVLTVTGQQGHVAYPHRAKNPLHPLVQMLHHLISTPLDAGNAHFEPSSLQITSIDVGNPAGNIIPAQGVAHFNVRFNDLYTPETLENELRQRLDRVGFGYDLRLSCSGDSFRTAPGAFTCMISEEINRQFGYDPALTTGGGTSDARFIKDLGPVVELGLVGTTMHQVNESVPVADLERLTDLYAAILNRFFAEEP